MGNTVRAFRIFLTLCLFCLAFFSQATATQQGDFTISASPTSLTVAQGNQGTSTITTAVSGGFNAAISLSAITPFRGAQLGFSFSVNPIPAPGAGSSILQITVGSGTVPGLYPVIVIASGGGTQHQTTITLTVVTGGGGTFKLSCTPALLHVNPGHQGQATILSKLSGGFNNSITLSSSGAPSGTTISFNPNPIPAPGSGSSMMTIAVGNNTAPGTYPITVTGNGGGVRQTTTMVLIVNGAASFTIAASPSSLTISQGNQGSTNITTTISNGFNSSISLSASGQPSGATVGFNPNPIPAPGSGSSSMTITVASNTQPGTYPITVTGNGGGTQQQTTVTLTVTQQQDQQSNFTISASPIAVSLEQGNQSSTTATTSVSGGFNSSVTLSATGLPDGTTVTFNPNPIPAPGNGSSTMTINVGSTTLSGSYPISITGNGGGLQRTATMAVTVTTQDSAGAPFPTPPQAYVDTTWNPPTTGTTRNVGCTGNPTTDGNNFQNKLNQAHPGDIIILQAGCTYAGNITLPVNNPSNGKWIYVESSGLSSLPPPGTRLDPSTYRNYLATVTTPNTQSAIIAQCSGTGACTGNGSNYGSNHFRFVGLELTSTSNIGCNPGNNPPIACWSFYIYQSQSSDDGNTSFLSDSITLDRCYIHGLTNGANSQDVEHGVGANATNFAVIDSYISDIHETGTESQGILGYYTPGPVKIVDNYISATTQEIMFGGAGGTDNPYVPSDIEIRRNNLFKPTSWDSCGTGGTVPAGGLLYNGTACPSGQGAPNNQWVEKNNLELKNARRVAITGNTLQNTWVSGQTGSSVLLTVRTSQSGNNAVVDDVLFQGNVISGVDSGVNTLEQDDQCQYTQGCTNPGEAKRNWVNNNLILVSPSLDNYEHVGLFLDGGSLTQGLAGVTDFIFQHNTVLMSDLSTLWSSIYTRLQTGAGCPPPSSATHNVWVLDTSMTRQPTGDCGYQGTTGLNYYMGDPSGDLAQRFYGNAMFVPSFDHQQQWPGSSNDATTTPFTYVNPGNGNYQLSVPDWLTTTDGNVSGMNWNALQQAMNP